MWNLSSVLLEVAVCVIAYVCVLWIEVLPAVFDARRGERLRQVVGVGQEVGRPARQGDAVHHRARHGAPHHAPELAGRAHAHRGNEGAPALAHGALLPLLALISCLSMGFGAVVVLTTPHEAHLERAGTNRRAPGRHVQGERRAALPLRRPASRRHRRPGQAQASSPSRTSTSFFFVLEMALFVVPAFMFFSKRVQQSSAGLFVGGAPARSPPARSGASTPSSPATTPGTAGTTCRSFGEIAVTVGMAAVGVAVFVFVSRLFSVVAVPESLPATAPARAPGRVSVPVFGFAYAAARRLGLAAKAGATENRRHRRSDVDAGRGSPRRQACRRRSRGWRHPRRRADRGAPEGDRGEARPDHE